MMMSVCGDYISMYHHFSLNYVTSSWHNLYYDLLLQLHLVSYACQTIIQLSLPTFHKAKCHHNVTLRKFHSYFCGTPTQRVSVVLALYGFALTENHL